MSTTFGIPRPVITKEIILEDDMLPEGFIESDFNEVVFRTNGGKFRWMSDIAPLLPDSTKIYPLDNSAQGIYSIGDVKQRIIQQDE